MLRTVPLSIVRSFSLYEHTAMVYVIQVCWQPASRIRTEPVWHIPLLCVRWKTPDDGQRNCPKHVEFYSKNKFVKLAKLVGFIIRIYHDVRSPGRQIVTLYSCTCWWQASSGRSLQSKTGRLVWRTRPSVTSASKPFFLIKKCKGNKENWGVNTTSIKIDSVTVYDCCVSKRGWLHALELWYTYSKFSE